MKTKILSIVFAICYVAVFFELCNLCGGFEWGIEIYSALLAALPILIYEIFAEIRKGIKI